MTSEGAQENLTPSAEIIIDSLPESVDDEEDWNLIGFIGKSPHSELV